MGKLNLLLIIKDYSQSVHSEPYYLQTELSKIANLFVWNKDGSIRNILDNINFTPDFILIYVFGTGGPKITELSNLNIPYGVYLEDLHYLPEQTNESMKRENVKYIFTCYRDAFTKYHPEFSDKTKWLPHHVNTEIFMDYQKEKDIDILLMGATDPYYYPLRHKILSSYRDKPNFVCHPHPGYRDIHKNEFKNVFVKERYAQEINRAKIFFTCNSIYGYTILKYFEVLACKTLLLAPSSDEILDLGLKPGVHFVEINENNFMENAEYYLTHDKEREEISRNGFELVQKKHSTSQRAHQLIKMISEILVEH
ncbi:MULTISPECIES: glycosyltransferase [Priestia]|uniref:glycosyltransferase family protein n=1 Tax=Priestia TaxID=2800373 RepID=UPI0004722888|nr:glycosyltransferase [Priestia megaterium]